VSILSRILVRSSELNIQLSESQRFFSKRFITSLYYSLIGLHWRIFIWLFLYSNDQQIFHFLVADHVSLNRLLDIQNTLVESIVFETAEYLYVASILVIFLLSLGNRPQSSTALYGIVFCLFALIMFAIVFLSVLNVFTAFPQGETINFAALITQPYFQSVIVSMGSTIVLYFVASFMYGEFWHMFTSFLQYLLMLPSFINVLMVYAFCNLHGIKKAISYSSDVSWGTKGDNAQQAQIDEAPVTVEKKDDTFKVTSTFPSDQKEIDAFYEKYVSKAKSETTTKKKKAEMAQEDYFKLFRTRLVLFWVFTNAALIVAMTFTVSDGPASCANERTLVVVNDNGVTTNLYLATILWAVAGLSAIRFTGSMLYLVTRCF
jgi:chitin synthase